MTLDVGSFIIFASQIKCYSNISVFLVVQIAKKCNESARDLENRELLNEISKNLVFKKVKVSNAFRVRYLCRLYTVMDF